jgi:acyl-CoA thioesterase I
MKLSFLLFLTFCVFSSKGQNFTAGMTDRATYLSDLKRELQKEWPKNRTINIVFHGHSVPAGYFKTPQVNTMSAYPHLFLKKLKVKYPLAAVNVIVTAID